MSESLKQLEQQYQRIAQLDHALTFLQWDQMVMMPDAGMESRSAAIAELAAMRHDILTSTLTSDALSAVQLALEQGQIDPSISAHIREMQRVWQQSSALPASLVRAQVMAASRCELGWRTQRPDNDWQGFLENFNEVVSLAREEAMHRQAQQPDRFATPYESLLDLHCAGDSQTLIDEVFTQLKAELPDLLQAVMEKQGSASGSRQPPNLNGHYPVEQQRALSEQLMRMLGFDFNAGRLDVSAHPFSTGGPGDQRITTRYREEDFADALQATAHETGHASYEAGLPAQWRGFPVGQSRNMAIHESQSLYFEKHLYLSRPMISALAPHMHAILPATADFSVDDLWVAQTRVKPSYIRVEADEVTYPLHVLLRYEIESALVNGDMEATDIPEAWDQRMTDYLGLSTADNHALGCLQDIHWTDGSFGYFPSYTLGAVNAAQISATIQNEYPDWESQVEKGETEFAREWLSTNIWQKASSLESQDLMRAATGESTSASCLLNHLRTRYLKDDTG